MSAALAIGPKHPPAPAIVRGALTALWKVWTAYTVKRAIAHVASTSDRDYREFGLDKAEMLAALRRLRDEIEGNATRAAPRRSCDLEGVDPCRLRTGLAISVAKREAQR